MQVVMQTLNQGFESSNFKPLAEEIAQNWRSRLQNECPEQSAAARESIIRWLLGNNLDAESISGGPSPSTEVQEAIRVGIARQAMEYRYRILQQRYLGVGSHQAYRNLTTRLSSLVLLRNKIRTWVSLSGDRQRTIKDILQEVIQELLQSDRYIQQQITSIAKCTDDRRLRNALLFAAMEEYCLRPVRNQPLIVYRFVNYLRRTQRGGLTQVPTNDLIKLVSTEFLATESENSVSRLDSQAITSYEDAQAWEEQQALRTEVKQEFESYLAEQIGTDAVQWLNLYLHGYSQEAIAHKLKLDIKQVYRLREKISYHAVRVFAVKNQSELVSKWLETSLQEHSFGLTSQQWQQYWQKLTSQQQQIIELLKAGKNIEAIAQNLNLKFSQVMSEWTKIYLAAQALRSVI
jgi:hypothetical protein